MKIKFTKNMILFFVYVLVLFLMISYVNSTQQIINACPSKSCIFNTSVCYQLKYSFRCDCTFNCLSELNDPCSINPCALFNATCTKNFNYSYNCSIPDSCADNKCQTMPTILKDSTAAMSSPSMSAYVFTGIISIIPVLLIVLVIILVTIARIIKCWKKNINICQHNQHRRHHRHRHRNQHQVVYSIEPNDTNSIFDYNQALSCSIEISKETDVPFKDDKLPSYQDALKMKPHE